MGMKGLIQTRKKISRTSQQLDTVSRNLRDFCSKQMPVLFAYLCGASGSRYLYGHRQCSRSALGCSIYRAV